MEISETEVPHGFLWRAALDRPLNHRHRLQSCQQSSENHQPNKLTTETLNTDD